MSLIYNPTLFPQYINIESSSFCNLKCQGCFFHGKQKITHRPPGFMDLDLWKTLIDEIGSWKRPVTIAAHGGGEPLLNPKFSDFLSYASKYQNICMGFLTNGMLLDNQWAQHIIDTKISWVAFSIDGTDHLLHEKIRYGSNLKLIENNIKNLILLRNSQKEKRLKIFINTVLYPEIESSISSFLLKWIDKVDGITVSVYRKIPNIRKVSLKHKYRLPCYMLFNKMAVTWDGKAVLCCEDYDASHILGPVPCQSLSEIWQGTMLSKARRLHKQKKYSKLPICSSCDIWADSIKDITLDKHNNFIMNHYASYSSCQRPILSKYFFPEYVVRKIFNMSKNFILNLLYS